MIGSVISVLSLEGRHYNCHERARDNYDIVTRVMQLISPSRKVTNRKVTKNVTNRKVIFLGESYCRQNITHKQIYRTLSPKFALIDLISS